VSAFPRYPSAFGQRSAFLLSWSATGRCVHRPVWENTVILLVVQ
jgi:hypothetical protein